MQEDFGLDWYDYGARFYDAQLGRFHTQDRFAEKYYSQSPYAYAANNPIKYIDFNGDSLWIHYRKKDILYENGNIYTVDKDGNKTVYSGKGVKKNGKYKGFLKKTVNALNEIGSKSYGAGLLSEIQNSENNVTITHDEKNGFIPTDDNYKGASNGDGSDGEVYWNTSNYSGTGEKRPRYIGLAHELAHGLDAANGTMNFDLWFYVKKDDGTLKPVYQAEIYSTHIENKIRAENGIPLRSSYQPGYPQSRILINGVESKYYQVCGKNYNYVYGVIRLQYSKLLKH